MYVTHTGADIHVYIYIFIHIYTYIRKIGEERICIPWKEMCSTAVGHMLSAEWRSSTLSIWKIEISAYMFVQIFQGLAVKAGMLQKISSPSIASLTRKWWKSSKIRDQEEEYGSKAVMGFKIWKRMEQTGKGGPGKAFPIYLLGNLRERRAQSSSLVAWLGDAQAPIPPAPCLTGTSCQRATSGKRRADTVMAVMPLWTTGEIWSFACTQLGVIWQKLMQSLAASA